MRGHSRKNPRKQFAAAQRGENRGYEEHRDFPVLNDAEADYRILTGVRHV